MPGDKAVSGEKQTIDPSLFNMWRCVIAIAHADGVIQPEERDYLEKVFANLNRTYALTADEQAVLSGDLDHAQDIGALLPQVTRPENRALLAHFSRIVAWADGELDLAEEQQLEKLHKLLGVNIDDPDFQQHIRAELAEADAAAEKERAAAQKEIKQKGYIFRALDAVLLKMGIDILD
jgi:uncharacterized tellurite resistance protein B-like protein